MKVLVAEDDPHMRAGIVEILQGEGYRVVAVADGAAAIAAYGAERPDFVCLDIMMPEKNGYDVCRAIRSENATVPILFLSAKSEEVDKVLGLELGADDYVHKPFGVKEFAARIRAIARRALAATPTLERATFRFGPFEVSPAELRAARVEGSGEPSVDLSLREVSLLQCFASHEGEVLDREHLFRACWGHAAYPNSRTLDQHVSKLRKKVEDDPRNPTLIRTVHGVGYRYLPCP